MGAGLIAGGVDKDRPEVLVRKMIVASDQLINGLKQ
jgi:hypothetical protein